jgi:hypothetical protein
MFGTAILQRYLDLMTGFLYGVMATYPLTFLAVSLLLIATELHDLGGHS